MNKQWSDACARSSAAAAVAAGGSPRAAAPSLAPASLARRRCASASAHRAERVCGRSVQNLDARRRSRRSTTTGRPRPWLARTGRSVADGLSLHSRSAARRDVSRRLAARRRPSSRDRFRATLPDTLGPAFEDVDRHLGASADQQIAFTLRAPFAVPAGLARSSDPKARRAADRHRTRSPSSDPKSPTELRGQRSATTSAGRRSIGSSSSRIRACGRPGPRCCAASSTCCTKSGIDALDSLETSTSVDVFTYHAALSVHRRPEHARPALRDRRRSPGAERGDRSAGARPRRAERPRARVRRARSGRRHWAFAPICRRSSSTRRPRRCDGARHRRGRLHSRCLVAAGSLTSGSRWSLKRQLRGRRRRYRARSRRRSTACIDARRSRRLRRGPGRRAVSGPTCCGRTCSGTRTGPATADGYSSPRVDAALDAIRHAADDEAYKAASRRFSAPSSTTRRRSFWPGASAPRREHALRACRDRARTRYPRHAATLAAGRPATTRTSRTELDGAQDPPHRDALRADAGAARPCCRWSPTASSRSSRSSAARASRSSPATRTSPPAPPRKSAATSSANAEILKALAADLQDTGLEPWQQDRILKNYVLAVPRVPRDHAVRRGGRDRRDEPRRHAAGRDSDQTRRSIIDGVAMSPIRVDDDLLPTAVVRHPPDAAQPAGRLAGRRVQPRRNVADGRSDPHRRARLRAGRRARRRRSSRTAIPTRRRWSRSRAT